MKRIRLILTTKRILKNNDSGNDPGISGSELDDKMEEVASEDEENNHCSLGGDDHNDLVEKRGV